MYSHYYLILVISHMSINSTLDLGSKVKPASLTNCNLAILVDVLRAEKGRKLYLVDRQTGARYEIALNFQGEPSYIDGNDKKVIRSREERFMVDPETKDIIDKYLKEKEMGECAGSKGAESAKVFMICKGINRFIDFVHGNMERESQRLRMIDLSGILSGLFVKKAASVTILKFPEHRLQITAAFDSFTRAKSVKSELIDKFGLNCDHDSVDKKKLVIDDTFNDWEIEEAKARFNFKL